MKLRINRYLKKVGYKYTSHDFRHTKITQLADAGLATKTMQMYVGHKSAATTMRYIHVEEKEALRQVAEVMQGKDRQRSRGPKAGGREEEKAAPRNAPKSSQQPLRFADPKNQALLSRLKRNQQTMQKAAQTLGASPVRVGRKRGQ